MESLPLSGQHAARAFLPPAADMLVAAATSMPLCGISRGVGAPPPTPVHAKRVCKHSQAAEPLKRFLSETFHLLLKKQDKIPDSTLRVLLVLFVKTKRTFSCAEFEVCKTSNSAQTPLWLFFHVVRRIAANLLGGGLVKFTVTKRNFAHCLIAGQISVDLFLDDRAEIVL